LKDPYLKSPWALFLKSHWASAVALAVAVFALSLSLGTLLVRISGPAERIGPSPGPKGLLEKIQETGELHAGYGVYPPYTQEDPNTGSVTGYSVEIIEQIAKELTCKVVWHRLNWNTMSADLKRGQFDVIADPIFQTIPRAREFAFTEPYAYFAEGIAVVRKEDNRFKDFASLNQAGITIVVGQGWASETLVKTRMDKPKIVSVQTATDALQVFNDVISGRADVAVADGADAERFVSAHPDKVKALWLDDPPAIMPAGFALRPTDIPGAIFLTVCLRTLRATGTLNFLTKKYNILIFSPKTQ
jgi:ABC-type amino acid transport substrate-binding protein